MPLSQSAKVILLQLVERVAGSFKRKPGKAALLKKCLKELNAYKKLQATAIDNYYNNDLMHTFELMKNKLALCYFPNMAIKESNVLTSADIQGFIAQIADEREDWCVPASAAIDKAIDDYLFSCASWTKYQAAIQTQLEELTLLLNNLYETYRLFIEEVVEKIEYPFNIDNYM